MIKNFQNSSAGVMKTVYRIESPALHVKARSGIFHCQAMANANFPRPAGVSKRTGKREFITAWAKRCSRERGFPVFILQMESKCSSSIQRMKRIL
jgi:hypothetical protein